MAYTQWAAVHGYYWTLLYVRVSFCVCVGTCSERVAAWWCYLLRRTCAWLATCRFCILHHSCMCLCLLLSPVGIRACMSVSLRHCGQWTLYFCIDSVPGSLPVSHSVVSSSSQQQANSQLHSLLNMKSTFPAYALCIRSFLKGFDSCLCKSDKVFTFSCYCTVPRCVGNFMSIVKSVFYHSNLGVLELPEKGVTIRHFNVTVQTHCISKIQVLVIHSYSVISCFIHWYSAIRIGKMLIPSSELKLAQLCCDYALIHWYFY